MYDRIQADDMKQASVIMAAFVYHAAMADEKLPRKPLVAGCLAGNAAQPAVLPAAAAAEAAPDKVPAGRPLAAYATGLRPSWLRNLPP